MLALIITLLLQLGLIANEQDYHDLDPTTQEAYQSIITEDLINI